MTDLYIGLMSGTSLDGVDGVLARFPGDGDKPLCIEAHTHQPFEAAFAAELLALNAPGSDELHRAALAGNALARVYALVVSELVARGGIAPYDVRAIGAHGQTVRHRPREFDGVGYTLQLGNGALLAELTGIDVIADFRSRDVAVFGHATRTVAVLNIGGMANVTCLPPEGATLGFDCGPGNALMDHWCRIHTGHAFDEGGEWAAGGQVSADLFEQLRSEAYFDFAPPKSTGRDLFNPAWLDARLHASRASASPRDVQATLAELTAWSCADAVQRHACGADELLVCGGGALNRHLMRRLAQRLPGCTVKSTEAAGLSANHVEPAAFAWLAQAFVERRPGNLVGVTGARGARILGALYPAG
jgi:anhydro-N-acetylmuramic acid kinase